MAEEVELDPVAQSILRLSADAMALRVLMMHLIGRTAADRRTTREAYEWTARFFKEIEDSLDSNFSGRQFETPIYTAMRAEINAIKAAVSFE